MKKILTILSFLILSSSINAQNIVSEETMFLNEEPDTTLVSIVYRSFFANRLVDAYTHYPTNGNNPIAIGNNQYRVCNGTPGEYENVLVYGKLESSNDTIIIDSFDLIKGFKSIIVELPFTSGTKDFVTNNGTIVSLSNTLGTPVDLWLDCDDEVFKKLQTIKHRALLKFTQFNLNNNNWTVTNPRRARHFLTALANLNYITSQVEFETLLYQYRGVLHGANRTIALEDSTGVFHLISGINNGKITLDDNGQLFTFDPTVYFALDTVEITPQSKTNTGLLVDSLFPMSQIVRFVEWDDTINRVDFLERLYNRSRHNLGFTKGGVNGLGGGTTLGIRAGFFESSRFYETPSNAPNPFRGAGSNPVGTYAHEIGHVLGYSHGSNMTYGIKRGSWTDIMHTAHEVYSNGGGTIDGTFYRNGNDVFIDDELPFINPIYIQDIEFTEQIDFGTSNYIAYQEATITIKNHDFKSVFNTNSDYTETTITHIDFPQGITSNINFPISLLSRESIDIPILINITNPSQTDTLILEENIRIYSENTLDIPVSAVILPGQLHNWETISVCNEYFWNNQPIPYTHSGIYLDTLNNTLSQDSVIALELNIERSLDTTQFQVSAHCNYTWDLNNTSYYISGNYYHRLENSLGCDSILALNLEIYQYRDSVSLNNGAADMIEVIRNDSMANTGALRMGVENRDNEAILTGLRFPNVNIPAGAIVTNAKIVFVSQENRSTEVVLEINGEKVINSEAFDVNEFGNISKRIQTNSTIEWNTIQDWTRNEREETNNLKDIVQEIIDLPGWNEGMPMTFIMKVKAPYFERRSCYSGSNNATRRPKLIFNYTMPAQEESTCNSFYWAVTDQTYTTSGVYTNNFNGMDCDSIQLLNLNISNNTFSEIDVTIHGVNYTSPSGKIWTDSDTYQDTILNQFSCDSIITINLTFNRTSTSIDVQEACNEYTWINGVTYTSSNITATDTLVNSLNADSIITLNLTINSVSDLSNTIEGSTISATNSNANYQWLDCDNGYEIIVDEQGQSFTALRNGSYSVQISENGCVDTTACVSINRLSVYDNIYAQSFTLYPNPIQQNFTIQFNDLQEKVYIKIYTITGKLVQYKSLEKMDQISLDLKEPNGIYFLEITNDKGESSKVKIVKI